MTIELSEPEVEISQNTDSGFGMGSIFGKCPVCGKDLSPRNKKTGVPQAPPVNAGYPSRARCGGCGAIIVYVGKGEWRVFDSSELTDEDREADAKGAE